MPIPKRRLFVIALGLTVVFVLLLPSLKPRPTPRYTVTDLGVLPGDTVSSASGINNHGDIVGFSSNGSYTGQQLFLVRSGRMTSLGRNNSLSENDGPSINDSGRINYRQLVSNAANISSYGKSLPHQAILYSGSRKVSFIMPAGWTRANLNGVNGQGQIVGICWRQTLGRRLNWGAFVYDSKTRKSSVLPTPPGSLNAEANGINDRGQIIGYTWQGGDRSRTVLWNAGQPGLLASLSGRDTSSGAAINSRGDAVGSAESEPNAAAQLVNSHNIRLRLLVPIFRRQWEAHAVVYESGAAQDLNTLIPDNSDWTLEQANAVNDRGQIVGYGLHHGQERAFLLTPT